MILLRCDCASGIRVRMYGELLEELYCFKNLGSHVAQSGGMETEVRCSEGSVLSVGNTDGCYEVRDLKYGSIERVL